MFFLEKVNNMATEEKSELKVDYIGKTSEKYAFVEVCCLKFLGFIYFLHTSLNKRFTTFTSFPPLDHYGMIEHVFQKKSPTQMKHLNLLNNTSAFKPETEKLLCNAKTSALSNTKELSRTNDYWENPKLNWR